MVNIKIKLHSETNIMKELKNEKLAYKIKKLYNNILKLKKLDIDDYFCANLLDWFNEII